MIPIPDQNNEELEIEYCDKCGNQSGRGECQRCIDNEIEIRREARKERMKKKKNLVYSVDKNGGYLKKTKK